MLDFGKWFAQQGAQEPQEKPTPKPAAGFKPMLPDGVWQSFDGRYKAHCNSCGEEYELPQDPIDDGFDPDLSYCGGSARCLP